MRIVLVGGIYGKPDSYRVTVRSTPEIVLETGLRARGHDVVTYGHHERLDDTLADVVHVHHLSYGAIAAACGARPFVFTSHLAGETSALRRTALRYVIARCDASVVLSEAERRWQVAFAPTDVQRPVIANGIDHRLFGYHPPKPRDGALELLYVGQLIPAKGLDYLLGALGELADELKIRLRLVYHVADQERSLRRRAADLQLDVEFLGARAPEELAGLYVDCHALVLPSMDEALPSVVTEAMLVGRPVLATDVGGVADQVGWFGRVVPAGSRAALARGIRELVVDYDALAARAREASQSAALHYSVDAMVDAHESLYRQVASAAGARRPTLWTRALGRIAQASVQRRRG